MCEAESNILFSRRKHQNHICHREALPCIHAFLGVSISPGICVDDLFRLIITIRWSGAYAHRRPVEDLSQGRGSAEDTSL